VAQTLAQGRHGEVTGRSTVYVALWAFLALVALAYLALLALRPDLATRIILAPQPGAPETNQVQRAMLRALTEIQELRQTAERLQGDISQVRTQTHADRDRLQAIETRLTAIEAQRAEAPPIAATAPPPPAPQTRAADDAAGKARRDARAAPQKAVAAAAGGAPREASAVETQALPAAKPAPVAVVVMTGPSLDAVRLYWQVVQEANKAALRGLEPRVVEVASDPPVYQLLAGPVATKEAATRVCERLRLKPSQCSVVPLAGQPL